VDNTEVVGYVFSADGLVVAVFLPPVAHHPSCHHSLIVSVSVIQQLRILSFQRTLALSEGARLMVQDERILREKTVLVNILNTWS